MYVTPFERILNHKYQGQGTEENPYLVDWLSDDPEDPQQWGSTYKWFTIAVASFATLAVALSSSAYSGGVKSLAEEFGTSSELLTAGLSLFVVGFAFGPLLWAPLSEVYGRRVIYWTTYVMLTMWTAVTCASQNIAQVLVFRCLSGLFGSSPLSNAGGTIADVLDQKQRGIGMAFFAAAPFLGPALGPISGGFIGLTSGWRWVEGFLAIFCGILTLVLFFFAPETYAPKILRDRALRLERATGKVYRFRADAKGIINVKQVLKVSLVRPWKFLVREPIVICLTLYTAIIYGVLYLEFEAYPIVFQQLRGWNSGEGGLAFLGLLVGVVLSVVVNLVYINPTYLKTVHKRGRPMPEDRLPPAIWGGVLLVIGLAGFAATNGPDIHWIAPIIFGVPFGLGMVVVFLACLGYLIESYTIYAASVLAANSVLRSLFGAAFPLFTPYMYERLGIHWASALPGFLALACIPFTVLFYKYGAQIRAKCKYSAEAERAMNAIIAAKMASIKQQQDEEAALENNGEAGVEPEVRPAESEGGQGNAGVEGEKIKEPHHEKEWNEYTILADRDMWDMGDEEKLRLEELHKKFEYAKAKKASQ